MIRLILPNLPPSINKLLIVSHGRFISSHEARSYNFHNLPLIIEQLKGKEREDEIKEWIGKRLRINIKYYSSWRTKAGDIRKKDANNLSKALIDLIFKGLIECNEFLDDCQLFEIIEQKIEAAEDMTEVEISVI